MEIYGIEHRKKVAEKYNLDEQEIIDLPREKFEIFVSGLEIGEKYGAKKVIDAIKADMEVKEEGETYDKKQ